MSAHTPGPWITVEVGESPSALAVADENGVSLLSVVCENGVSFGVVYNEEDAALIAAAPELLEALDLVASLASQEWQETDGTRKGAVDNAGNRMWFINENVMQEVRAAIAKAGGAA